MSQHRIKLCRVVTVPITFATLLRQQIRSIVEAGIDLTLVSSPGDQANELCAGLPVRHEAIPMARKPAPWRDIQSLCKLARFFRRERFDIVHSSTPKAGLLTALAGAVARVPVRIHTFTGQVWVELNGPMRWLLRKFDWLIGRLDTHTFADSHSQRELLVTERLVPPDKIQVLGHGSISGVDLRRFDPSLANKVRAQLRHTLGIGETSPVIVFVGRITKDKGICELLDAFRMLCEHYEDIHLLLVGPLEVDRSLEHSKIIKQLSNNARIHPVGFAPQPEEYLAMADIFCLPSYREGFGSVAIEAGAMMLPSVATRVTGLIDAVVDGETGILVPPKDVWALKDALKTMIESPDMRCRMGQAARLRAVTYFDAEVVNRAVVDEYARLAKAH